MVVVLLPRIVVVNKWMTGAGDWVAAGVDVDVRIGLLLVLFGPVVVPPPRFHSLEETRWWGVDDCLKEK